MVPYQKHAPGYFVGKIGALYYAEQNKKVKHFTDKARLQNRHVRGSSFNKKTMCKYRMTDMASGIICLIMSCWKKKKTWSFLANRIYFMQFVISTFVPFSLPLTTDIGCHTGLRSKTGFDM